MLKGIMRKIAIITNVLLVMQFAFLGAGSAYAGTTDSVPVTNLNITPTIQNGVRTVGLNTEFPLSVKLGGTVYNDISNQNPEFDARIYGVVTNITDSSNSKVVADDTDKIWVGGDAMVLKPDWVQKAKIDEVTGKDTFVFAFEGKNGFDVNSSSIEDITGAGLEETGFIRIDETGTYKINYYAFAGPDLMVPTSRFQRITLSDYSETITVEATNLAISYKTDENIYSIGETFNDEVTLTGKLYDDVTSDRGKLYFIIKRTDSKSVLATDFIFDGDSGSDYEATSEERAELEKLVIIDPKSLVLGWPKSPEDLSSLDKNQVLNGLPETIEKISVSKDGIYKIDYVLFDTDGQRERVIGKSMTSQVITIDGTAPVFIIKVIPEKVNNLNNAVHLNITANEKIEVGTLVVSTQQGTATPISQTTISTIDNKNFVVTVSGLLDGDNQLIKVFVGGSDMYGNSKAIELAKEDFSFVLDTKALDAVTNLTATYSAASGSVTLSWTNPTSDYLYVQVLRDSLPISVQLDKTTTSYTDYYTVRGKTYSYNVFVIDAFGNKIGTAPVSVTIPPAKTAVVASGVSDSYSYGYASVSAPDEAVVSTEAVDTEATDEDSKEVKADDVATGEDDSNTASEKDFPTWGIIALIFLLALGGYLFWVQKPEENEPTVYVEKKSGNGKGKKKQK